MRSRKLTHFELYNLVKNGRYDEIPAGYNIKWLGPEPGKAFEFGIPGEEITVTRNPAPVPTSLHVVGTNVIAPPFGLELYEKLEYGDVYFTTNMELSEIKATYDLTKIDTKNFMEWVRRYSETITGRVINKADVCFDMKAKLPEPHNYMEFFNVMMTEVNFPGLANDETVTEATADLICDYFHIEL